MTTHITQAATTFVPVTDQDRSIAFYVEILGFEKRADFRYAADERWVEVVPPGAATAITLVQARGDRPAGVETGIAFVSADADADHAALRARGADVDERIMRQGDPVVWWSGAALAGLAPMFLVRDPDGNSFLIVQGP